jgi:pimeloyl-ACP methyl ester carboxylesterase
MASMNAAAAATWIGSPMHQTYVSVAPNPEAWTALADKLGQMLKQDYDWSDAVAAITAPIMIVVGDADGVRTAHAVEFFELLGGGKADAGWDGSGMSNARPAILPATTHYDIFGSPLLTPIVTPFLDAPMPQQR